MSGAALEIVGPDGFRQDFRKIEGINSLWVPSYFIMDKEALGKMSPKIATLIAIETGILVGLMSWLTYSHFPSSEPHAAAGMQKSDAGSVRTVAPPSEAIS